MHIAFVTPEFLRGGQLYPGGLSTYTFNTAMALKERGHLVTIFLSGEADRTIDFKGLRVVERKMRIPPWLKPVHHLFSRWIAEGLDRIWASKTINDAIRRHIQTECIHVVHYTNWKAIGLFSVSHPAVLRISSYDTLWDNNPGNLHIGKRFSQWLEKRSIRRFEHIIGPGDHLAAYIERDLGLRHPIALMPTPVDLKETTSVPTPAKKEHSTRKKILYAGTVSRIKGAVLLFEIITAYLRAYDDVDFVVAGKAGVIDGLSCRPQLDTIAAAFPGRFRYHPHLERSLLLSEYQSADIVIIPSLIDNFPNTALEAMSKGALVLASDTASLGTLLKDEINGFVMQGRDHLRWIARIRKILFELPDEQHAAMTSHMLKSIQEHGKEHAIGMLESMYKKIAGQPAK